MALLLQMQIVPIFSRAGNMFCCSKTKNVPSGVKNIFASRTQILRPKHMFSSLATPGNIVSATMFPSLAKP